MNKSFVCALIFVSLITELQAMEKDTDSFVPGSGKVVSKEERISHNKQKYFNHLTLQIAFLDAYLNCDLEVVNDEFRFQDSYDETIRYTWPLEEGLSFFNVTMPLIQKKFVQEKYFLIKIDRLEHKLAVLKSLNEEDKLLLQIHRCKVFQTYNYFEEKEKAKLKKELQETEKELLKAAPFFKSRNLDDVIEFVNRMVVLREALKQRKPSIVNDYLRSQINTSRFTVYHFIAMMIVNLENQIKELDEIRFNI